MEKLEKALKEEYQKYSSEPISDEEISKASKSLVDFFSILYKLNKNINIPKVQDKNLFNKTI
jgi:hypothetical protein